MTQPISAPPRPFVHPPTYVELQAKLALTEAELRAVRAERDYALAALHGYRAATDKFNIAWKPS
jgi:hypothetical protein